MITQGKWEVTNVAPSLPLGLTVYADGKRIAVIFHNEEQEANANLIARAPRLEEENSELVEVLKEVYAGLMRGGKDSWTVRQIREVLSKAKGES